MAAGCGHEKRDRQLAEMSAKNASYRLRAAFSRCDGLEAISSRAMPGIVFTIKEFEGFPLQAADGLVPISAAAAFIQYVITGGGV